MATGQLTEEQMENIQCDFGVLTENLGETTAREIAPVRGGITFTVTKTGRYIEHDYAKGPEKGMYVVDDIDAMLAGSILDTSVDNLAMLTPYTTKTGTGTAADPYTFTADQASIGVLADAKYSTNIGFTGQTRDGKDIIIKLYNALNTSDFSMTAVAKGEAELAFEMHAHFDPKDKTASLYDVIKEGADA